MIEKQGNERVGGGLAATLYFLLIVVYPIVNGVGIMHIVLVEPEIPGNTGNIARLCAATGCELHLVRPLGFSVDDRHLKRAGLDYWHLLKIHYHDSFQDVLEIYRQHSFYLNTTKASKNHTQVTYTCDDLLVFGKETAGLPEALLRNNPGQCIRIPMIEDARSLNLSNAVAVVVYEALRQQGFPSQR
jgi:tRNA (cytidine/uridine-2'-O-)-methyltransferase